MDTNDGYYEAFWPRTPRQIGIKEPAQRLASLDGKTIAFLWDYIFRGDEIWAHLQDGIAARYRDVHFVDHSNFGNIHAGDEKEVLAALPAKLADLSVDAVVVGMAC